MAHQIVVSCRMGHGAVAAGGYLERARSLMTRAEALGATLAAWSATTLAFAWDAESIEEAISLAVSLREGVTNEDDAWTCGIAEGDLQLVAPTGQRADLAWGEALVAAVSLARVARPGEVLLDGDVRAVRVGELAVLGSRVSTDSGKRVRGWRLNTRTPWRVPSSAKLPAMLHLPESAPASIDLEEMATISSRGSVPSYDDLATTQVNKVPNFTREQLAAAEALGLVEAGEIPAAARVALVRNARPPAPAATLEDRIRAIAHVDKAPGSDALMALRRARAEAEKGSVDVRCQAALALAVGLALAGRAEEALLEGLDALARAREVEDVKAMQACVALLSKLYAGAGRTEDAAQLKSATG